MSNGYYTHGTYPASNASGSSSGMRAELNAVMAGFDLLPDPLGIGQKGFIGGTWQNPVITGGSIDNTPIGQTAALAGSFTALVATSAALGVATAKQTVLGNIAVGPTPAFVSDYTNALRTFGTSGAFDLQLITNGTLKAVLNSAGRFVLGNGVTDDGAAMLQVGGTSHFTGAVTLDTTTTVKGSLNVTSGFMELGSTTAAFNPTLDFHSSGLAIDYDSRITANGGTATPGTGSLFYFAASHVFDHRPTFAGNVPWDAANLANPFRSVGGNITGDIALVSTTQYSPVIGFACGASSAYNPYIRGNSAGYLEFINGARTAINLTLREDGYASFRSGANFALRPTWQGLTPYDNGNFNPAAYVPLNGAGTLTNAALNIVGADPNAVQVTVGQGYIKMNYNTAGFGPYIDFASLRSQDYVWRMYYNSSDANMYYQRNGSGYLVMGSQGDIFVSAYGWLGANAVNYVSKRNGLQGNGFVWALNNSVQIGWNGAYNMFTDNSYQGDMLYSNNYTAFATPRTSQDYGGVGSYTFMNTGSTPGAGTVVGLPGLGGSWRTMSGGFGGAGHDVLYCRIS